MIIYLVKVNDKISSEAYRTIEEAHEFIFTRASLPTEAQEAIIEGHGPYFTVEAPGFTYTVLDVRVK